MIEYGLRRNALASAVPPCAGNRLRRCRLRLCLLDAGTGLFNLRLQRARVDFRQHVTELHLLADGEVDGLQLPTDFERKAADIGRLQNAGKTANRGFRPWPRPCTREVRGPVVRRLPAFYRRSPASRRQGPLRSPTAKVDYSFSAPSGQREAGAAGRGNVLTCCPSQCLLPRATQSHAYSPRSIGR